MSIASKVHSGNLPPAAPVFLDPDDLEWNPYVLCKTVLEFLVALCLLVLAGPVIVLSALLVRLTSRGPAFYSQTRLGLNGRPYSIYKLRTMYHNCERTSGPQWSTAGDARITPVGHFLRRTHLDELPQLINVLRGDMSLVGPRPERPEFIPALEQALPHYRERLRVRPGVTGLAQIQLPADSDLESVRRKLAYDLYYIRYQGPWLDFRILAGTALKVFGVPFEKIRKVFFVPSQEVVEMACPAPMPESINAVPCLQPEFVRVA
jgi:lipopolysaccharide/colanic/teichoic acid biosynthesis glycosyltransferase